MMMDRRAFLLSSAGAAAAPGVGLSPDSAPPAGALPPATAPGYIPGDVIDFEGWRTGFLDRAVAAGWTREQVRRELDGVTLDPRVVSLDNRQPELSKPVGDYLGATVSATRVQEARVKRQGAAGWLDPVASRSGVPAEILVAVWGIESSFGVVQGDMDVVRCLATLAAEGRRREFAEGQLLAALRIVFTGEATRAQLKGSWAGAMGQTQFTPDDYLRYGVDADGDGRRDIWRSSPDALGSSANFLSKKANWRRAEPWQAEVILPGGFDYGLSEGPLQPLGWWRDKSVQLAPSLHPRYRPTEALEAGLILPQGWTGPAFLTFANHRGIKAYNNSTSYALAVGLLADRIAGAAPLAKAWPPDRPTTLSDRIAAQATLMRLGYDTGGTDGVIGANTRKATRAWQAARGLPADGYLSYALIQRLKAGG